MYPSSRIVLEPVSLLVVEPHADTRETFIRMLRHLGYRVTAAAGAREALRLCLEFDFDLMVCEPRLPDGDGVDLMHRLAARHALPAMAISTAAYPDDVRAGLDAGFRVYLTKPLPIDRLADGIHQALGFTPIPATRTKAS